MAARRQRPARDSRGRFTKGDNAFPEWLKEPAKAALAALATAGGLLTFVAAVGGAIVWVRFYAAELPADQALAVLPRGELIASGAVMLAVFMILGVLAAVGVYLFDRNKLITRDDRRVILGLIGLVVAEALVVVALAVDVAVARRVVAGETVLLLAFMVVVAFEWRERLPKEATVGASRESVGKRADRLSRTFLVAVGAGVLAYVLVIALLRLVDSQEWSGDDLWIPWLVVLGVAIAVIALIVGGLWILFGAGSLRTPGPRSNPDRARRAGLAAIVALNCAIIVVPALIVSQRWLAVTLGAAVLLAFASWRVARTVTNYQFLWCAIAVFVSVPLLGAVAGITRNFEQPQVQPMALIRKDDGATEAIQGIYVTETDDRVYFANVATDRCTGELESRSGRLLWVPRKQIVAMSLGPPQSVQEAGTKALEMYYAFAPAAFADSPATTRKVKGGTTVVASQPSVKRRLENVGPALRRDFDLDPELSATEARAEDRVVLSRRAKGRSTQHILRIGTTQVKVFPDEPKWGKDNALGFKVPKKAAGGVVTIECGDVTPQPYLSVRKEPVAKIHFVMRPGRQKALLDGRGSTDRAGGAVKRWTWAIQGHVVNRSRQFERSLSSADDVYTVALKVRDNDSDRDTTVLRMWRRSVPAAGGDAGLAVLPLGLRRGFEEPNARLVIHGYSGLATGSKDRIARYVKRLRKALDDDDVELDVEPLFVPATGKVCPQPRPSESRRRGYIEVYVVTRDVEVDLPEPCETEEIV